MQRVDRRTLLQLVGTGTAVGLAGCVGGGADDSGNNDDGSDDENTDDTDNIDPATFPEFTPSDPEYPQLLSTLLDAGFETGTSDDLERMRADPPDEVRYGGPVQETPDDESQLIDPDTIRFSVSPTEDPQEYAETFQPLVENMEAETGKKVEYISLESYAAQVESMQAERLHVAGFSTGTVPFAVNLANAVPFSIQVEGGEATSFGYRLFVITQLNNTAIRTLSDLEGADVAHTSKSSNSGNLAPRALFAEQGITPGEAYEVTYSGGHQESALGVANGDYDAAPVCSTCVSRVVDDGEIDPDRIRVIWASRPFPTTGFCYRNTLRPELQDGIVRAFIDYDYQDTSIAEDFGGRGTWIEIDYATVWDIILKIQASIDTEYTIENVG